MRAEGLQHGRLTSSGGADKCRDPRPYKDTECNGLLGPSGLFVDIWFAQGTNACVDLLPPIPLNVDRTALDTGSHFLTYTATRFRQTGKLPPAILFSRKWYLP